jgi:hypothetical protein
MNNLWSFLSEAPTSTTTASTSLIPLPSLAVLSLTGPESAKFLQGQATTDFREVEKGRVLPGAICSLKGRVLYSFIAVPNGANIDLLIPDDQIAEALTHLKKYAIFSKTQLQDAREQRVIVGIQGENARDAVRQIFASTPETGSVIHDTENRWVASLFDSRYLVSLPASTLQADWKKLNMQATITPESAWWLADIAAGYGSIFSASRDLFQPQELNYPSLEGVSYNKGCYTGQEIVARLYFRGKLKQRLYRFTFDAEVNATTEQGVFSGETRVGDVVMMASCNGKGELLAIVKNKAIHEPLTLGLNGITLQIGTLPYALPAEKEE